MSRPPIMIAVLKPEQNVWKIAVRAVDVWNVKERNGQQHVEAILQDAKADKIHVVTRSRDFDMWTNKLVENQTFMVYNGEVSPYDLPLRVCDNQYKLFFNRSTTVTAIDIPEIPSHSFEFKSFADILNGDFVVDRLYDIIGVVQQVSKAQSAGAGKKACVNLTLSDESGTEMDITLWEGYANQFMNYASDGGQVVIILTHGWCRPSSSNGKLNISNAWSGSKLLINNDIPQVADFKAKFLEANHDHNPSQSFSLSSCSQGSFDDRAFSFSKDVKSIGEMVTLTEETFCNTVGKTMRFRANPFGWYYELCPTCNKTNQSPGSTFKCNCTDANLAPITKYKIEVEVEHGTSSANFVFWDKECIPFVGMSAHALRELMKPTNEDHPLIYPAHLDHLLGKKFAIRAKYQPYYKQASVVRLTQDEEVIQQIEECITPPVPLLTNTIPAETLNPADSEKGKALMFVEDLTVIKKEKSVKLPKPQTSAAQNWVPETSINNTPSKRLSPSEEFKEDDEAAILSPKLSATKSARTKAGRPSRNK